MVRLPHADGSSRLGATPVLAFAVLQSDATRMKTDSTGNEPEQRQQRNRRELPGIFFRGMAMGAADIVPGVSGGTIALVLGVYERLINSLQAFARPDFLRSLFTGRWGEAARVADLAFLGTLGAGILTSVFTLANLLGALLGDYPVFVFAFFFGLVAASILPVASEIERFETRLLLPFLAGAVGTFFLLGLSPAQTPDAAWFVFLSGALAISALLLPGISGAFILVMLGKYEYALTAVSNLDLPALLPLVLGIGVGLISFAMVLGWLFRRFRNVTLTVLAGVLLGSLRRVWPYQTETQHGQSVNMLPDTTAWAAADGWAWSLLLAIAGAAIVVILHQVKRRRSRDD